MILRIFLVTEFLEKECTYMLHIILKKEKYKMNKQYTLFLCHNRRTI